MSTTHNEQSGIETIFISPNNNGTTLVNNVLTYPFPLSYDSAGDEIALANLYVYYSWPNIILNQYNNAACTYTWSDGSVNAVNFPNGFYNVSQISAYIQFVMQANTHYVIGPSASGSPNIFFMSLAANGIYYAVTLTVTPVPTSAQATAAGYTQPAGASWSYPLQATTPLLGILNTNNFGLLIGFTYASPGPLYPATAKTVTYSLNGDIVPEISPVTSISILCNFVNNTAFNSLGQCIYTFSPQNGITFGSQISVLPTFLLFFRCLDAKYSSLVLTFVDQNGTALPMQDPALTCTLAIRRGINLKRNENQNILKR